MVLLKQFWVDVSEVWSEIGQNTYTALKVCEGKVSDLEVNVIATTTGNSLDSGDVWFDVLVLDELDNYRD